MTKIEINNFESKVQPVSDEFIERKMEINTPDLTALWEAPVSLSQTIESQEHGAIRVIWLLSLLFSVERIQENKHLTELVDNWDRVRTVVVGSTGTNSVISSHSLDDWNPSFVQYSSSALELRRTATAGHTSNCLFERACCWD